MKQKPIRSKRLREWARDNPHGCQIRYPGLCEWQNTCGSHAPSGIRFGKGTAHKPHDILALACPACHDIADGRVKTDFEGDFIRLCWLEAMYATMVLAIGDGIVVMR